jgi:hypothetical protein
MTLAQHVHVQLYVCIIAARGFLHGTKLVFNAGYQIAMSDMCTYMHTRYGQIHVMMMVGLGG